MQVGRFRWVDCTLNITNPGPDNKPQIGRPRDHVNIVANNLEIRDSNHSIHRTSRITVTPSLFLNDHEWSG